MDWTIIWIILGVVGAIGFVTFVYWGLKKIGVPLPDVFNTIDVSKFVLTFINMILQESLDENPTLADKIEDITLVVLDSMTFIADQLEEYPDMNAEQLIANAQAFADDILDQIGIKLNENEKEIVYLTIRMTYNALIALPV